MKKPLAKILSLLLSLQMGFAPLAAFAADEQQQPVQEMTPPPAFQEGEILSVPLSIDELPDALSPEMKQRFAGIQVRLGTREEIAKNRPSLLAKSGNVAVHLTSQYIYFQAVMGLSAMVGLAMNYANDPIALQNYIKSYTSLERFGESVSSFGAFLFADWATGKLLRGALNMKGPHLATTVQQIAMGAGLLASTVMGEIWNDKNIIICAKSRGTDLEACDGAFDSWVKTNRIVQYIPMIIQNTTSALLSASITNMVRKGTETTKSLFARKTAEEQMLAALKKSAAQRFEDGLYLKLSNFGTTGKIAEAVVRRGFVFAADLPGAVVGLGMFMVVDAVISSPLMKAYTRNYIDEQNTWWSLRKFKDLIGKTSVRPINWATLNLYVGISSLFPNQFPKIDDEKARANWLNEFNLETFLKFFKLWAKYNVAARNQSGTKSLWNMLSLQPISGIKRDATVVETPQDGFEIMRDAHEAILSSLDFSNKDGWQTYNVDHCGKTLSTASQLTFQQAVQFYIGLNAAEKSCIVDIDIYDNLVSYIERNKQHRDTILAPLLTASKAWTEALTKFLWMTTLSKGTYEAVLKSKFANEHGKDFYPGRTQKDGTKAAIPTTKLTYQGIEATVKQIESKHQLEAECAPDNEGCIEATKNANDGFLPESFWMNDSVGKARIRNNTDYLIAEMACGPDVKDTSSYWLTAKNYESTVGHVFQAVGSLFEKAYKVLDLSEGVKVFGVAVTDPNSAMIYTPAGLYPRFIPPRIVTGNGQLCEGRLTENNSVEKGKWSDGKMSYDGILSYVLSHVRPELMVVNPDNSNFPNFSNWYLANIAPVYNQAIAGFQNNYNQIIQENLRPNLLRNKFTDGCTSGKNCFQSWKTPKVSQGVYQSMEVEIRVLLGLLNEIYIYPTEMMAKARELDDKNPISTSSILREKRKAQLTPEALEKFDTRLSIFVDEANYTNAQYEDDNSEVKPVANAEVRFYDKLNPELKKPFDFEGLKARELTFIRGFKAKMADTTSDKNGPVSFNVEQSDTDLSELQKFFTQSRVSEINDLQAKVAGLIFRALESLLQERNSYNNLLQVDDHPEIKGDQPQAMRKGANRLIEATKPKDAAVFGDVKK